ncbi:MAG: precorrin-6y C5,15-methyltransferase (decarboxylating) subunit CbiE [Planctomycetaceae bacterium]|nr:precorrin-6y C5,15-methyltransferase (decarboxylating) subunit CbiE [Planctomycetaceae bacterium]
MANSTKITIVGVGDDGSPGLSQQATEVIARATKLYGSTALLERFCNAAVDQQVLGPDLDRLASELESAPPGSVVLASGDPLFYGTARFLCERLGKETFEVIPHVSSMQLAFARVKESWDEAYLTNVANQPLDRIVEKIRTAEKVGLFTSQEVPPSRIAELLLSKGIYYFTAYVCENLGAPDERVTKCELNDLVLQKFAPLNVLVLLRHNGTPDQQVLTKNRRLFGNPDEFFKQSRPKRGLLTTSEVRSIALSEMNLRPNSIVWDIGAGSGSVAIEAAQIANQGKVYAIEMDAEDYGLMLENAKHFGVENLVGVLGQAPKAWEKLPDPHAIFVGGTGRAVTSIVQASWPRLQTGGTLVVNVMSIENVSDLQQYFVHDMGLEPQLWMIQISRGTYQLEKHRFETANPSFLVKVTKP